VEITSSEPRAQASSRRQTCSTGPASIPPRSLTAHPRFTIESEYRAALEGDFVQILYVPHNASSRPGSLLIVAGDVTGKGLQAEMLVALLVGATRSKVELKPDPIPS
jgi:hypothetical protein